MNETTAAWLARIFLGVLALLSLHAFRHPERFRNSWIVPSRPIAVRAGSLAVCLLMLIALVWTSLMTYLADEFKLGASSDSVRPRALSGYVEYALIR